MPNELRSVLETLAGKLNQLGTERDIEDVLTRYVENLMVSALAESSPSRNTLTQLLVIDPVLYDQYNSIRKVYVNIARRVEMLNINAGCQAPIISEQITPTTVLRLIELCLSFEEMRLAKQLIDITKGILAWSELRTQPSTSMEDTEQLPVLPSPEPQSHALPSKSEPIVHANGSLKTSGQQSQPVSVIPHVLPPSLSRYTETFELPINGEPNAPLVSITQLDIETKALLQKLAKEDGLVHLESIPKTGDQFFRDFPSVNQFRDQYRVEAIVRKANTLRSLHHQPQNLEFKPPEGKLTTMQLAFQASGALKSH